MVLRIAWNHLRRRAAKRQTTGLLRTLGATCLVVIGGALSGCGADEGMLLPDEAAAPLDQSRFQLVARFVQITDTHIVDEESPGRLTALANAHPSAWRPQERFSIHLFDGIIRAVNAYHELIDEVHFVIHTGDVLDNAQANELSWTLDCLDGRIIDPLSGVDDRPPDDRGPQLLDPHVPFQAEGLYRKGTHGQEPSIPWYALMGNHERYAVGIFPLLPRPGGGLMAPLPGPFRTNPFLPAVLIPDGTIAYGAITPADPGPPHVGLPVLIQPNPERRFIRPAEFIQAHFETLTGPVGHGFTDPETSWYSLSPVAGLRLIVLDTSIPAVELPAGVYASGAIVACELAFLTAELDKARAADELVLVATHHPSFHLRPALGSAVGADEFRALLNAQSNVIAHLAGHTHRHRVWDRGNYVEFETGSIIDFPQEARLTEIWRAGELIELRYLPLSHLYEGAAFDRVEAPEQLSDPFVPLRREALRLAEEHAQDDFLLPSYRRTDSPLPLPPQPEPRPQVPSDRMGIVRLSIKPTKTN